MTEFLIAACVVASIVTTVRAVTRLSRVERLLDTTRGHEHEHCHQIGEVQHVVAEMATHIRGMTAGRLPADVETFVDEMQAYDDGL